MPVIMAPPGLSVGAREAMLLASRPVSVWTGPDGLAIAPSLPTRVASFATETGGGDDHEVRRGRLARPYGRRGRQRDPPPDGDAPTAAAADLDHERRWRHGSHHERADAGTCQR